MNANLILPIVQTIAEQYEKFPANPAVLTILQQTRKTLANCWLKTPSDQLQAAYLGDLGKTHQILLYSGIKHEPIPAPEQPLLDQLISYIARGFEAPLAVQSLLAAMLYCRADQLPIQYQNAAIPQWFLHDFLIFLLDFTPYFSDEGDIERYYHNMQSLVEFIHLHIVKNPTSKFWQEIAQLFIHNANLVNLYFSPYNLKNIFTKRAEILEFALTIEGAKINYSFETKSPHRPKIRLGILKASFMEHPETFTTIPLFEQLDRSEFEIILYVTEIKDNFLEKYCFNQVDQIVLLEGSLNEQVQTIRGDDLDILLVGSIVTNSLYPLILIAAHRLARIQMTYFASPVTTGMKNIDYYISGDLTEPEQNPQEQYQEQLILLKGTGFCFNYAMTDYQPQMAYNRKEFGIPKKAVVFISGANFYKITPEVREVWAKILAAVPHSVLMLYPFSATWKRAYPGVPFINKMQTIFEQYGIEKRRLFTLKKLPNRADVQECLKLADVYLDSFPYTGANSTLDPLEVGLPTVVMQGNTLRSRQSAAMLKALHIPDLVVNTKTDYINLAVSLGTNPEQRQFYREQILKQMQNQPTFLDSRCYAEQLGIVFKTLIAQYPLRGLKRLY